MIMRQRSRSFLGLLVGLFSVLGLGGCYEELEPQQTTSDAAAPAPAEPADEPSRTTGGTSVYGGAKRAAEDVVNDLEQRDRDILKQLEEDE
jgi:hypothetical protein